MKDIRDAVYIALVGGGGSVGTIITATMPYLQLVIALLTIFGLGWKMVKIYINQTVCRPMEAHGNCWKCKHFGTWLCPGAKLDGKHELVENTHEE